MQIDAKENVCFITSGQKASYLGVVDEKPGGLRQLFFRCCHTSAAEVTAVQQRMEQCYEQ